MFTLSNAFFPYIGAPGLSVALDGGVVINNGSSTFIAAQTISLAANSTTYIFLNTSAITVQSNTSGFTASNCYPIAIVTTTTDTVTTILDMRPDIQGGGSGGSSTVSINGSTVTNPNFNDTTPAAAPGFLNVTWHVSGSDVSASIDTSSISATPAGNTNDIQYNNSGVFGATDNFAWDIAGQFGINAITTAEGAFFTVDNQGTSNTDVLAIGTQIDLSGGVTFANVQGMDIAFRFIDPGTTITTLKGLSISGTAFPGTAISTYTGLLVGQMPRATTTTGIFIDDFSNGGDLNSRALLVFGGIIEFPANASLMLQAPVVAQNDPTTGFTLNFSGITPGNIWIVSIPDSDSSTAVQASPVAGQALASFDATTGLFSYTAVGTGTVTSFSAGALSPLFTTNVATATTTPALTFALTNAAGGTVFGRNASTAGAPSYTAVPVLGISASVAGSLGIANGGVTGKIITIQNLGAVAADFNFNLPVTAGTSGQVLTSQGGVAASMTWTTPTTGTVTSVALATGAGATDALYTITGSPVTSSGTLVETLINQTANFVFAGPTSGGAASPTFRALVTADIPSGTVLWNQIGNATGALTLANGTNATTFNQTSAVTWSWANTTAATSSVSQSSVIHSLNGTWWDGAASQTDSWTIQNVLANGTAGNSQLKFIHSGTTGSANVNFAGLTVSATNKVVGGISFGTPVTNATYSDTFGTNNNNVFALIPSYSTSVNSSCTLVFYTGTSAATTPVAEWKLVANANNGNAPTFTISPNVGRSGNTLSFTVQAGTTGSPGWNFGGNGAGNTVSSSFWSATSGTQFGIRLGDGSASGTGAAVLFNPASGTANFIAQQIWPTINQTSTASGNYTALKIAATETSLKGTTNALIDCYAGSAGTTQEWTLLNNGTISVYAATALVGQGVPSEIGTAVDSTAQSAAIAATNIIASAPRTGMYRISWSATITTAASTSSVLGGTNGFQIGFTSPTDSVAKTVVPGNSTTSAGNTTATAVAGSYAVYAKTGTAITYAFDYTSVGVTAMVYELHVRLEAM